MAGMFYSLKETADRLGKTEDEVRQLAREGRLREFRDGSNLLFKIQEVNALLAENIDMGAEDELELEELSETAEQPADNIEDEPVELEESAALLGEDEGSVVADESEEESFALADEPAAEGESFDEDIFNLGDGEIPEPTAEAEAAEEMNVEEEVAETDTAADLSVEEELELEPTETTDATSELGLAPVADAETGEEEDFLLLDEEEAPAVSAEGSSEEISLAPESGILASESDITDMDTALTGEGVNVLGDSDADYGATDDSMAETAGPAGTGTEASLEEIEDDVNLDSFGSGSGLLDLSLQADDTSLGGILDEIYTAEGGEEEAGAEGASFDDITAEAEHPIGEEDLAVPEPVAVAPMAIATAYAEAPPDAQSNLLGMLLFLPLLALLYATIVAVAGMRNVMPSILESIQGMVWYLAGGGIVVALIVTGASFVVGGEKAPRAAKPKKEKKTKVKGERPKKEKKEKAKKEKPAKQKKNLFGKKKG